MTRQITAIFATTFLFLSAVTCQAKETATSASTPKSDVTIFLGAKIIDGTGNPAIENGALVVRGDKIQSVSAKPPARIPAGARVIDAHGKTIMPALMEAHSHLGLLSGATCKRSHETTENDMRQLQLCARYGIGGVMSLGTDVDLIYPLREQRRRQEIGGPYIFTAGRGFGTPGGAPPANTGIDDPYRPSTVAEALQNLDELLAHKPDIVKVWVDDLGGTAATMKPEIYKAIIDESHRRHVHVAAHVWALKDAKQLAADGIDLIAHSIRDLPVDQEFINTMKAHGTYITPTLAGDESMFVYKDNPDWMKSQFFKDAAGPAVIEYFKSDKYVPSDGERQALAIGQKNLKTLYDAGVNVALGADTGSMPERVPGFDEHRELQLMVAAGLTPMQVITCATKNSAQLLGVSKTMGTLSRGKLANLLVLDADPLVDISNTERIASVWLDGKEQPR